MGAHAFRSTLSSKNGQLMGRHAPLVPPVSMFMCELVANMIFDTLVPFFNLNLS